MDIPHRYVSWDEFHLTTYKLAQQLKGREYAGMIILTRGGLTSAGVIAGVLDIKVIETLGIESYHSDGERDTVQSDLRVHKGLGAEFLDRVRGQKILVVDEVCDTGKTAIYVRRMLQWLDLTFDIATPYVKPLGKPYVDVFQEEVPNQDTWIDFSWEVPPVLLEQTS